MINTLNLNDFSLLEEIGSGSFGDVYKVKENKTGNILAAKISKEKLEDKSIQDVRELNRETEILSKVNHPAILKFIGISSVDFSGNPYPVIITEFLSNGTLLDVLELERSSLSDFKWTDTQKLINIYGIAKAMSFLHSHNIIHRDLKPANILMDEFLCPKIADFGLSKRIHYNAESIAASQSTLQIKGTPMYIAPESWTDMIYSPACDVYAFGMIIYEIITGIQPYSEQPFAVIMLNVTSGKRPPIDEIVPPSYKNLIERCWSQEASKRPTFEQIIKELKTNEGFITELIESDDYQDYINYIDHCPANFDSPEPLIKIDEYIGHETQTFKRIKINELLMNSKNSHQKSSTKNEFNFFPPKIFKSLSEECKQLIEEAKTDPYKQLEVGEFLVEGKGKFPQNTELGMKFLDLSSKSGNSEATVYYTQLLIEGEFVPPDLEKAKMILSRCTEQSSSSFIFLRGKIAKKEKDYALAMENFVAASKLGNAEAMYECGKMLTKGHGCQKNEKEAKKYFKMATKNGYSKSDSEFEKKPLIADKEGIESMKERGKIHPDGSNAVSDKLEALKSFKKSAEEGDAEGMAEYAVKLYELKHDKESRKEAVKYFRMAAEKGNAKALNYLGTMLFEGQEGVEKEDKKEAAICYKKAAELGFPAAMCNYGFCLQNGEGVEKADKSEAVRLFRQAADGGDDVAMCLLGFCFENGDGVKEDSREASKYFRMAAEKGNEVAIRVSASYLENSNRNATDRGSSVESLQQNQNSSAVMQPPMNNYQEAPPQSQNPSINQKLTYSYQATLPTSNSAPPMNNYQDVHPQSQSPSINQTPTYSYQAALPTRDSAPPTTIYDTSNQQNQSFTINLNQRSIQTYKLTLPTKNRRVPAHSSYQASTPQNFTSPPNSSQGSMNVNQGALQQSYQASSTSTSNASEQARYYKAGADSGSASAMNSYGLCLQDGIGVEKNESEAARYFKMATDRGDPEGKANYGHCLFKGKGVRKNLVDAMLSYKDAAEMGNTDGMVGYGYFLLEGERTVPNKDEALRLYKKAADQGNVSGMIAYGHCLYEGNGTAMNLSEAMKYFKMAADKGDAETMVTYGDCLLYENCSTMNMQMASYYYKMSADRKNLSGAAKYGNCLLTGMGVPMNKSEGIRLIKDAAENGNAIGMMFYGLCLIKGDGVPMNKDEGARYIKKAADSGNPEILVTYGTCLQNGLGVEKNLKEAANIFRAAANKDNSSGLLHYGLCKYNGQGEEQNKEVGENYIRLAAEKKNLDAMFIYADILFKANKNLPVAVKLMHEAAERGHLKSINALQANKWLLYLK